MHRAKLLFGLISVMTAAGVVAATLSSPYAGQELREIKALSPDDVASLLAGDGIGLAKAAELNGYPRPAHVLELATELALTSEQRSKTEALRREMSEKARSLGRAIVEKERALDRMFADKTVTPDRLSRSLAEIGALQAQVRDAHLEAHLAQVGILTSQQNDRYNQLRGYGASELPLDHEHMHHDSK